MIFGISESIFLLVFLISNAIEIQTQNLSTNSEQIENLCRGNSEAIVDKRFFQRTGKCYNTNSQGPCLDGMIFVAQGSNSLYGHCICFQPRSVAAYHPVHKKCFSIFTQGYCSDSKWLTLNADTEKLECSHNICRHLSLAERKDYVPLQGQCVKLFSKCGEESSQGNIVHKFIMFDVDRRSIVCSIFDKSGFASGVLEISCGPGKTRSRNGKCASNVLGFSSW